MDGTFVCGGYPKVKDMPYRHLSHSHYVTTVSRFEICHVTVTGLDSYGISSVMPWLILKVEVLCRTLYVQMVCNNL